METVERAGPAGVMSVARLHRFEAGLMKRQLGLPAKIGERDGHHRFRAWLFSIVQPDVSEDQTLRVDNLAIHALQPVINAFRRAHAEPVSAAGTKVDVVRAYRKSFWRALPARQMLGFGPGVEDKLARRVENALYQQLVSCGGACGHSFCPSSATRASATRADIDPDGRGSLPRNGGSGRASRRHPAADQVPGGRASIEPRGCEQSGPHVPRL